MAADHENVGHDADLVEEFEALARRAGIEILDDRREAMLETFRDYRRMTGLLHGSRPASVEGANIFTIETVKRGR